jgi:lipopolysaccharide transport system ATP-binding protein
MYVRLAFAVAAHLDPEILVVDEVLAVGDAGFQKKCLGKMGDVAKEGRTVLFVSHNMGSIGQLCKSGVLLDSGKIFANDDIEKVISLYLNSNQVTGSEVDLSHYKSRSGNNNSRIISARLFDGVGNLSNNFFIGDILKLQMIIRTSTRSDILRFSIDAKDDKGRPIFHVADIDSDFIFDHPQQEETVEIVFRDIRFYPGRYFFSIWLGNSAFETYDQVENIISFNIEQGGMVLKRNLPLHAGVIFIMPEITRIK